MAVVSELIRSIVFVRFLLVTLSVGAETIPCDLIVGYPKWLDERYQIYKNHVLNDLNSELNVSTTSLERLERSDLEQLRWLRRKPKTTIEYFQSQFNASTFNETEDANANSTCIYDTEYLKTKLSPKDMQLVENATTDDFGRFCTLNSTWELNDLESSYKKENIMLWPNGFIRYVLHTKNNSIILHAMETIMYMTCLTFRSDYNTNSDHYLFVGDGLGRQDCNSTLGMKYNNYDFTRVTYQSINLHPDCLTYPIVLHLLLHTLGLPNEQQRIDRDDFINIHYNNVNSVTNLERTHIPHFPKSPYLTDSIMHFRSFALTNNTSENPSMTLKNTNKTFEMPLLGSLYDFQRLNYLYGCHKENFRSTLYPLTKDKEYDSA